MATTQQQPQREPADARNLDGYGAPEIPWAAVRARLEQSIPQEPGSGGPDRHTCWLATTGPDGRPHVVPLGVIWVEGACYFTSGAGTRKSRNLARDPHCVLSVATHEFDLVIEGTAVRVTDAPTAERIAAIYRADGWPATVAAEGSALTAAYSAPSAGPPPWDLYAVTPETVFAFGTAPPYGATRWRFAPVS
jgi:hypothetical protein